MSRIDCKNCGDTLTRKQRLYCSNDCRLKGLWTHPPTSEALIEGQKHRPPISDETRKKMGQWQLGRKLSEETKAKLSKSCMGRPTVRKGQKHSVESRRKMSKAHKGKPLLHRRGENSNFWKGGTTSASQTVRNSMEYSHWRLAVYERDDFTCQHCGDKRGSNLVAHHIKSFTDYSELRFVVENGLTLCVSCHMKHHYGQKEAS